VAVLVSGSELRVFVNGEPQALVSDDSIPSGRVGVGGFAPTDEGMSATITKFRAWRLP
jgi:hypothetical protein